MGTKRPDLVRRFLPAVAAAAMLASGLVTASVVEAPPAAAATSFSSVSPPFTSASDFATNFPDCGDGPSGLASDGSTFLVADGFCGGNVYKFSMSGGDASSATSAPDQVFGLGYLDGTFFAASEGGPIEILNPTTLALSPSSIVIPDCGGAMDIKPDNVTGDLYASSFCGVWRIQNPTSASPTVTLVSPTQDFFDGIDVSPDGQHVWGSDYSYSTIVEMDAVTGAQQASIFVGSQVTGPDGIAVAPADTVVNGVNVSGNVFVNDNDGTVLRIDTNNGDALSIVASGGTRGDLALVGPDGCFYVTQSDRVEKLAPCFFTSGFAASFAARATAVPPAATGLPGLDTGDLALTTSVNHSNPPGQTLSAPGVSTLSLLDETASSASPTPSSSNSQAQSELANVSIDGGLITAQAVTAVASAAFDRSSGTGSASASGSSLVGLQVDGTSVADPVPPNTTVPLPGGASVTLNEQIPVVNGNSASMQVNMIDLRVQTGGADLHVVVGSAYAAAGGGYPIPDLAHPSQPQLPPAPTLSASNQELIANMYMSGIACWSPTTCLAVGESYGSTVEGTIVPIMNGVPGTPVQVPDVSLQAVSCAETTCLAVGSGSVGNQYGGVAIPITSGTVGTPLIDPGNYFYSVSCPALGVCYVAGDGVVPYSAGSLNTTGTLYLPEVGFIPAISCPSVSFCEVAGEVYSPVTGSEAAVEAVSVNPISSGLSAAGAPSVVPGMGVADAISCGSLVTCEVAGENYPIGSPAVASVNAGQAGSAVAVPSMSYLSSMTCPSVSQCLAGGTGPSEGAIVSIDAGMPGSVTPVANTWGVWAVADPSPTTMESVGIGYLDGQYGTVVDSRPDPAA